MMDPMNPLPTMQRPRYQQSQMRPGARRSEPGQPTPPGHPPEGKYDLSQTPGAPGGPTQPYYSQTDANGVGHAVPAPGPQPTFAQMQQAGQARPAPPPMHVPQQPSYAPQLTQAISQALVNPSAYGSDQVMQTYNRLGQNIDDQYAQQKQATDEEMARRGLYDSTLAGGKLHDLNIGQRDAKTALAQQLATSQAQDYSGARSQAIAQALQAQGQDQNYGLQQQQFGLNSALGYGNLDLSRQSLAQQGEQAQHQNVLSLLSLLSALGIDPSTLQGG